MFLNDPRLKLDLERATDEITGFLSKQLAESTRGRGFVIGLSGGVDSATTAALAVRAVGSSRVHGLLLPERHSDPQSEELAMATANTLGITTLRIEMTEVLESLHVYEDQEELLRTVDSGFDGQCRFRLVLPDDLRGSLAMNVYTLEVFPGRGAPRRHRIGANMLRQLQALTNVKLRLRMVLLYREAESRGSLVVGTTNRCETDQGFFVQYGDGAVDLEPIAHLYKCQVRELALHLGLPEVVASRPATPDTWSAPVHDDEFFFRLPYEIVDSLLVRDALGLDDSCIANELDLSLEQVARLRGELARRRRLAQPMREMPPHLDPISKHEEAIL